MTRAMWTLLSPQPNLGLRLPDRRVRFSRSKRAALHSAPTVVAPVRRVATALRRALAESRTAATPTPGLPSVEVVVARYAEDPAWCRAAGFNCTIYNKGDALREDEEQRYEAGSSACAAGRLRVRSLPNVGRESHTFLSHIVSHYEQLAEWRVFMQGDPFDHLPTRIRLDDYVQEAQATPRRDAFFLLTAVVKSDLRGLAFRTGYSPFAPFTGELVGPPGRWAEINRARLPLLLQPLGLWSGEGESEGGSEGGGAVAFVNRSLVAVPSAPLDAGLRLLQTHLHWIDERRVAQRDSGFGAFWRRFLGGAPPSRLYHAQGAQFGVSAAAIRRHPPSLYRALLEVLERPDPVGSYYMELVWWYLFDEAAAHVLAA